MIKTLPLNIHRFLTMNLLNAHVLVASFESEAVCRFCKLGTWSICLVPRPFSIGAWMRVLAAILLAPRSRVREHYGDTSSSTSSMSSTVVETRIHFGLFGDKIDTKEHWYNINIEVT